MAPITVACLCFHYEDERSIKDSQGSEFRENDVRLRRYYGTQTTNNFAQTKHVNVFHKFVNMCFDADMQDASKYGITMVAYYR